MKSSVRNLPAWTRDSATIKPVDVVIRPEDIDLVKPEEGTLQGIVTHLIFKGVHYEMEVTTPDGYRMAGSQHRYVPGRRDRSASM